MNVVEIVRNEIAENSDKDQIRDAITGILLALFFDPVLANQFVTTLVKLNQNIDKIPHYNGTPECLKEATSFINQINDRAGQKVKEITESN